MRYLSWRAGLALVLIVAGLSAVVPGAADAKSSELAPKHVLKNVPDARAEQANNGDNGESGVGDKGNAGKNKPAANNGITYHNGTVVLGTTHAYVIWYGNWGTGTTPALVNTFFGNVGGSPYFNINTTYYNAVKTKVTNSVTLAGSVFDSYSQGHALSDAGVQAVVANAISSNALPSDTNGVYFVLTSSDVSETSGFLTQYCGWHTNGTIGGADIKFSFVGDASAKLSACAAQTATSPNANPAGDAMISVIAHELEEAVTDPDLNAWYDSRGYENADKCAWTFGTTYKVANGSLANMKLGGLDFLIQRNWVNASGGLCALKY